MADPTTVEVELFARTELGLVRERNEDAFVLFDVAAQRELPAEQVHRLEVGPGGAVMAVLDGMGGAASGDIASRVGQEVLTQKLREGEILQRQDIAEALGAAAVSGHREIRRFAAANRESRGMGTTLTACAFVERDLVLLHIGDSRAYLFRGGALQQVTEDHSLVQEMLSKGRISADEVGDYVHSNVILQALGVNRRVYPHIAVGQLQDNDVILVCSDGLSDLVDMETIQRCMDQDDLAKSGEALVAAAEARGGHDNITVVLGRVLRGAAPADDEFTTLPIDLTPLRVSTAPFGPPPRPLLVGDRILVISAIVVMLVMAALVYWMGS